MMKTFNLRALPLIAILLIAMGASTLTGCATANPQSAFDEGHSHGGGGE